MVAEEMITAGHLANQGSLTFLFPYLIFIIFLLDFFKLRKFKKYKIYYQEITPISWNFKEAGVLDVLPVCACETAWLGLR